MIKTPTLYVLVGLPGSGKSTWAEANKQWNVKHISSDAIRRDKEASGEEYTNSDIFKEMYLSTRFWIGEGYSIIYDATNLESKYRKKFLKEIKHYCDNYECDMVDVETKLKTIAVVFTTPLGLCLERNSQRQGVACVPEDVIRRMSNTYTLPSKSEGFDEVIYISPDWRDKA